MSSRRDRDRDRERDRKRGRDGDDDGDYRSKRSRSGRHDDDRDRDRDRDRSSRHKSDSKERERESSTSASSSSSSLAVNPTTTTATAVSTAPTTTTTPAQASSGPSNGATAVAQHAPSTSATATAAAPSSTSTSTAAPTAPPAASDPTARTVPLAGGTTLAAILAKAAAAKEALKKKLEETPAPPVAPAVSPALSTLLGQKNAELATRLSSNPAALSALERAKKQAANVAPPLLLDKSGRAVDALGVLLPSMPVATAKINQRLQQEKLLDSIAPPPDVTQSKYYDPRMPVPKSERDRKGFDWVEAGSVIERANRKRALEQIANIASASSNVDIIGLGGAVGEGATPELLKAMMDAFKEDTIPSVEWWDAPLLLDKERYSQEENGPVQMKPDKIHLYVVHPVLVDPPLGGLPARPTKVFLTKKETKKLRRINRAAAQKEKQERVMLGLEAPEADRVNLKNMMLALGKEAVQDPTRVEQYVKQQMKARLDKHLNSNAERKLTPQERKAKKLQRIKDNPSAITHVSLFKVHNMSNPLWRRKIDYTVRECGLTGLLLMSGGDSQLVLVEGAPKAVKKFQGLMLRRIDWTEKRKKGVGDDDDMDQEDGGEADVPDDDDVNNLVQNNKCYLVWEGTVLKPSFKKFRFHQCVSHVEARAILAKRGVEHYWDMVLRYQPPEFQV